VVQAVHRVAVTVQTVFFHLSLHLVAEVVEIAHQAETVTMAVLERVALTAVQLVVLVQLAVTTVALEM
jgi:hypothetical protein